MYKSYIGTLFQTLKPSSKRSQISTCTIHKLDGDLLFVKSFIEDLIITTLVRRVSSRTVTIYLWSVTYTQDIVVHIFNKISCWLQARN